MITKKARRKAAEIDAKIQADREELNFVIVYRICPRCAGSLTKDAVHHSDWFACKTCHLSWLV